MAYDRTNSYLDLNIEPFDMEDDLWWLFDLQEPIGIETRQPLIDAFLKLGIGVAGEYISDPHYRIVFHEREAGIHFEVSNSDDVSPYLALAMRGDGFLPPDSPTARLNADRFLEYGKVCYRVLKPIYAFAETPNSLVERKDVEAHRLTNMFWAQFFGPDFVKEFGQEVLINAPAWRNENLGDGGLLYVLAPTPYFPLGPRGSRELARRYFEKHMTKPPIWISTPLDSPT